MAEEQKQPPGQPGGEEDDGAQARRREDDPQPQAESDRRHGRADRRTLLHLGRRNRRGRLRRLAPRRARADGRVGVAKPARSRTESTHHRPGTRLALTHGEGGSPVRVHGGRAAGRWFGKCPGCNAFGSLVEETPAPVGRAATKPLLRLVDVDAEEATRSDPRARARPRPWRWPRAASSSSSSGASRASASRPPP